MSQSTDPIYHQAIDLIMLYQPVYLMVDYFHLRGIAWAGEQDAIRCWQIDDAGYLDLFGPGFAALSWMTAPALAMVVTYAVRVRRRTGQNVQSIQA